MVQNEVGAVEGQESGVLRKKCEAYGGEKKVGNGGEDDEVQGGRICGSN